MEFKTFSVTASDGIEFIVDIWEDGDIMIEDTYREESIMLDFDTLSKILESVKNA